MPALKIKLSLWESEGEKYGENSIISIEIANANGKKLLSVIHVSGTNCCLIHILNVSEGVL